MTRDDKVYIGLFVFYIVVLLTMTVVGILRLEGCL